MNIDELEFVKSKAEDLKKIMNLCDGTRIAKVALGEVYITLCAMICKSLRENLGKSPERRTEAMLMVEGIEFAKTVINMFKDML